jgi:anti-anti-sigma regulatory factor
MQTPYTIIAEPHPTEPSVTFLLNGKFDEDAIRDLESSILEARGAHQHVYIDLSEVTLVDRKAVRYLSEQANRNIQLVNCPIYLRGWITQVSE